MIVEVESPFIVRERVGRHFDELAQKSRRCPVARDEILIDVETDEVVLEVPSPQAGVLVEIIAQDGETVVAEQLLAKIDTAAQARSGRACCRSRTGCSRSAGFQCPSRS